MKHPKLVFSAVLLAGLLAAWQLPALLPKEEVMARADPACDLQKTACGVSLPDGSHLTLSFAPFPQPNPQPFRADVRFKGMESQRVEIDFAGATMNMGPNRVRLKAVTPDHYSGEPALSVCVSGGMDWVATVTVETRRQIIRAPFRFHVGH